MAGDVKNNSNQGAEDTDEIGKLKQELEKIQKEREEYLAGWQRAKADFINYKKEEFKRLEEIARYGNEELLRELIAVLDSFDLGLAVLEKAGPVEKGVYMIRSQLEDVLKSRGLERIPIKIGEQFDPSVSEAIVEIESDKPAGAVLEEIEAGYKLYDKILRPARVKISKGNIQEIEEFCRNHNLVIKRTIPYPLVTSDDSPILSIPLELSTSDSFEKIKDIFNVAQFRGWRVVGFNEHNEVGPAIQFKRKITENVSFK